MKHLLLIALAATIFAGCKDDETSPISNNTSVSAIVGTWNFASASQEDGTITTDGELTSTFTAESSNEVGGIEFKSDGNYTRTISYTTTLSMTTSGSATETEIDIPITTLTGTYSYDKASSRLTLKESSGGTEQVASVVELSDNVLEFTTNVESSETENGVTTVTKFVARHRYTK